MGWDSTHKKPFVRGGIFGHLRAMFGVNEEQGRMSLHSHVLAWLYGHDALLLRMQKASGRASLERYIQGVISAVLPWPNHHLRVAANTCASEACKGKQSRLELNEDLRKEARVVRKGSRKHPLLLECVECKERTTPAEQRSLVLQQALAEAGYNGEDLPSSREELVQLKWNGMPFKRYGDDSKEGRLHALLGCLIGGAQQSHKPTHHATCLKSRKATLSGCCRANSPACSNEDTKVEPVYACSSHPDASPSETKEGQDGSCDAPRLCSECSSPMKIVSFKISLRRDPASTWVAAYNVTLGDCCGCNCNVQYCKNCIVSLYAGMYGTKSTKENTESLANAVNSATRTVARLELDPSLPSNETDFKKGLALLNSAWRGHTKSEVVGCPRAGLLCLDMDLAWFMSHECVNLYPTAMRDLLLGQPSGFFASANSRVRVPQAKDYFYRPSCLEELDPLAFFENYDRVTRASCYKGNSDSSQLLEYQEKHPLAKSHVCCRNTYEQVATIHYKRLANREALMVPTVDPTLLKEREEYAQIALVLCCAYRTLEDLVGFADPLQVPAGRWWEVFVDKLDSGSFTARGQVLLDCAQEWFSSPLCDDQDVLGGHGPASERASYERNDLEDEIGGDVCWAEIANACTQLQLAPGSSIADELTLSMSPDEVIAPEKEMKMKPSNSSLTQFMEENYNLTGKNKQFSLLCGHADPEIDNPAELPDSSTPHTDISTMVSDMKSSTQGLSMEELLTQRDLIMSSSSLEDIRSRLNMPKLSARPTIREVAELCLLGKEQLEAFGTLAATFLKRLIAKYPHDHDQTAEAQAALDSLAASERTVGSHHVVMLGARCSVCVPGSMRYLCAARSLILSCRQGWNGKNPRLELPAHL